MVRHLRSIISTRLMTPHSFKAQIAYIAAVIVKSLGMAGSAILISSYYWNNKYFKKNYDRFEVFPGGFPGYVSSFAFCNILASWCCVYFGHFNASKTAEVSVKILEILSYVVLALFFILTALMFFINETLFHSVEAIVALIRDFVISVIFLIFIIKVRHISGDKQGSVMYVTAILIVLGLVFRLIYNGFHVFLFYKYDEEFSLTFLILYVVFFFLSDGMPFIGIAVSRSSCSNDNVSDIMYDIDSSILIFSN